MRCLTLAALAAALMTPQDQISPELPGSMASPGTPAHSIPEPGIDIRSYGAACDGATNDAPAILAAIRSIPASGGTLEIPCLAAIGPPGIFVEGRTRFMIRATAPDAGFRAYTADGRWTFGYPMILLLRDCVNCAVRDLRFEGNHLPVGMLRLERNQGTTVENNVIQNTGKTVTAALMGMSGRNNRYLGNTIDTTADTMRGMWIGNPGDDLEYDPVISGNIVRNVDATGLVATVSGGVVSYNLVEKNHYGGIKVSPLAGDTKTVRIEHNRTVFNRWSGITIGGDNDMVMRVSVRQNHVEGMHLTGIGLDSTVTGDITANTVLNNHRNNDQGWLGAIYLRHARDLVIEGNRIEDTNLPPLPRQDHGIVIDPAIPNGVTNLTITNNLFRNHAQHAVVVQARFRSTVDGVAISDNAFVGNSGVGLHIVELRPGTIRNVTASGNCFAGNGASLKDNRTQPLPSKASSHSCSDPTGP